MSGGACLVFGADQAPLAPGAPRGEAYVRPRGEDYEVLAAVRRSGPVFDSQALAIEHATDVAPLVVVLDRRGRVEREVRSRDDLRALVAEYYALLATPDRERGDGSWAIVERFCAGEHVGWFVEHGGCCYGGFPAGGADGPYATREAARGYMAMHLRAALAAAYAPLRRARACGLCLRTAGAPAPPNPLGRTRAVGGWRAPGLHARTRKGSREISGCY